MKALLELKNKQNKQNKTKEMGKTPKHLFLFFRFVFFSSFHCIFNLRITGVMV